MIIHRAFPIYPQVSSCLRSPLHRCQGTEYHPWQQDLWSAFWRPFWWTALHGNRESSLDEVILGGCLFLFPLERVCRVGEGGVKRNHMDAMSLELWRLLFSTLEALRAEWRQNRMVLCRKVRPTAWRITSSGGRKKTFSLASHRGNKDLWPDQSSVSAPRFVCPHLQELYWW